MLTTIGVTVCVATNIIGDCPECGEPVTGSFDIEKDELVDAENPAKPPYRRFGIKLQCVSCGKNYLMTIPERSLEICGFLHQQPKQELSQ